MESENQTDTVEFLLLGLSQDPDLQTTIFGLFLSIYQVTVLGNLLIILVIMSDSHLHTHFYFFLCNLSFTDISFISTTISRMLVNIQRQSKTISYTGCLTQVYFALVFVGLENFLLVAMAYDRYLAICHPLRYTVTVIMNPCLCVLLIMFSLFIGIMDALLHSLMLPQLSFSTDLEIPHFFCELVQVINLARSDILINNVWVYLVTSIVGCITVLGIIYSYIKIVSSVLRMPSSGGKYKDFSTCGSHLSLVSLFYGTGFGVYISSALADSSRKTSVASVMNTVVPPMMNPFIYSLRSRDMKAALRKLITPVL